MVDHLRNIHDVVNRDTQANSRKTNKQKYLDFFFIYYRQSGIYLLYMIIHYIQVHVYIYENIFIFQCILFQLSEATYKVCWSGWRWPGPSTGTRSAVSTNTSSRRINNSALLSRSYSSSIPKIYCILL